MVRKIKSLRSHWLCTDFSLRRLELCWLLCLIFYLSGGKLLLGQTNDVGLENYAPYLDGKPWPLFPITQYVETASNIWVHPSSPAKFPTVQEEFDTNADFTTVVIRCPNGDVFKTYNKFVLGPCLCAVYSGDFNGDGKPDFLAIKYGGGNGLAGEYCTGVFAFSENGGYQFTRVETTGLGFHDLVLDPKTKTFRLIHRSYRSGKCPDGRYHSFWVNRFYKWNGESFQEDDLLSPIWIQYLERPNHEATKLLTLELKQKIWIEDPESDQGEIEW